MYKDRNTRTLIVCFVIAILALIPLRLTAEGQMRAAYRSQVLGRQTQVVLPEVKTMDPARLESPYNQELEEKNCLTTEEANGLIEVLTNELTRDQLEQEEVERMLQVMKEVEEARCE